MKKRFVIILFFTFILLSTSACAITFKGRVIDADTKEPIDGAVVVAEWIKERATVAGPYTELKDVKETLTDKSGEWAIKGPKGRRGGNIRAIFTFLTGTYYTRPPLFIVFKPGYCPWPRKFMIEVCKEKTKTYNFGNSSNIGEILELPKLTRRKDRLRAQAIWPLLAGGDLATAKKLENFVRLLDKEERNLGLTGQGWIKELDAKVSDYLILNDIGPYKLSSKSEFMGIKFRSENKNLREVEITTKRFRGEAYRSYKSYKNRYLGGSGKPSLTVEIKEYYGTGQLLHNIEYDYRDKGWERLGVLIQGTQLRLIDGNKIISLKGRRYSWISKNVVVQISISSSEMDSNKLEPNEVIQAYLHKFPSTIPKSLTFDRTHNKKWIKDEIEKRLLICNNLFQLLRTATISKKKALKESIDSLYVFLDYRERYYDKQSKYEKQLLHEYLKANNRSAIQKKLSEYNKWWRENKGKSIDLL